MFDKKASRYLPNIHLPKSLFLIGMPSQSTDKCVKEYSYKFLFVVHPLLIF